MSKTVDLIPNGRETPVTKENRYRYIALVSHYRLNAQIRQQSAAFVAGLQEIIDPRWLRVFNQSELRLLVGGAESPIDLDDRALLPCRSKAVGKLSTAQSSRTRSMARIWTRLRTPFAMCDSLSTLALSCRPERSYSSGKWFRPSIRISDATYFVSLPRALDRLCSASESSILASLSPKRVAMRSACPPLRPAWYASPSLPDYECLLMRTHRTFSRRPSTARPIDSSRSCYSRSTPAQASTSLNLSIKPPFALYTPTHSQHCNNIACMDRLKT